MYHVHEVAGHYNVFYVRNSEESPALSSNDYFCYKETWFFLLVANRIIILS
jgi:hypothetical protein